VFESHTEIERVLADRISELVRANNRQGRPTVLGLATGSTPLGIYRELIRMHREDGLDFSGVHTFNLDEYYSMDPESPHSYSRYMRENFFDDLNIPGDQIHIPRGDIPEDEVEDYCRQYEEAIEKAGGIDFQILGIGRTGHIGFNEPGSGAESRTGLIFLDTITRRDAAADFFGEDNVPQRAITMGVGTILEAREIALVALGEHKSQIVRRAVEGKKSTEVAATYLQDHANATVYLDEAAATRLTRVATPWLVGEVEWTRQREAEAVIWLSNQVSKSILRLENEDYRDRDLSSLVARYGSAAPLNGEIFNTLIAKIRGKSKLPQGEQIVVFSPHPDDDVISMGGILRKLNENDNEITLAYQTSGNIAVFDHDVRRYLDFLRRSEQALGIASKATGQALDRIEELLRAKSPGSVDPPQVADIKQAIREAEAVSAIETLGLAREQARFLNMPFYQTGKVKKDPIGDDDVRIVLELIDEKKPGIIFAAGDYSDPHGTHRMCKQAIDEALQRYQGPAPEVWLYRGAWEEWPIGESSILVPMSGEELDLKIKAIFKHQSQKDKAPFPGIDEREFWQRVRERNLDTAQRLANLGLPAYFAMESYVVEHDGRRLENPPISTGSLAHS
jgi:glucosamine-6-phosphate deaminase